ncbi:MAG: MFS transporter [Myxococcota bacterium]
MADHDDRSADAGGPTGPADDAPTPAAASVIEEDPRLVPWRKAVFGSGDFTVNTVLTTLSLVYVTFFLVNIAGLSPALAGAVQLVGRLFDAFADPAMGRFSDRCPWKWGRRRPFFVLGAIPCGAAFGLMWLQLGTDSQWAMFAYYTSVYVVMSLSMTVLAVPYLALQPELALGYDARTSLNAYRNAGSIVGVFAAILLRPIADALGGGPEGYMAVGALYGAMIALPWFAIYGVTWERPDFQDRANETSFFEGVRIAAKNANFRALVGLYLCGRTAMDLVAAVLIIYFTAWLFRTGDFEITMGLFFVLVVLSLPFWVRFAQGLEKSSVFMVGSLWWAVSLAVLIFVQPDWPRMLILAAAPIGAIGYAVMDLMPWSMLGEVVDEDDLETGERREGTFYGLFMFLRKLAGTLAVAVALFVLERRGYAAYGPQPWEALTTIRWSASLVPAFFVLLSVWFARSYTLTRARHNEILAALDARNANAPVSGGDASPA